jgi:hypothetical protein
MIVILVDIEKSALERIKKELNALMTDIIMVLIDFSKLGDSIYL